MRIRWTTGIVLATGVLTLIAGVAAGGGTAHAATTGSASAAAAPLATTYLTDGELNGAAATASGSARAVGYTGVETQKTLILHWTGKTWS